MARHCAKGSRTRASIAALVFALAIAEPASAAQFAFAAFGDTPYHRDEELRLVQMIGEMNHERLALALHVGDFKAAYTPCTNEMFLQRRDWFALSHHPFFLVPGDNEWSDCWRPQGASRDALERLAKLRELFFSTDSSLGQRPLRVERQSSRGYPEHLRWTVEDVLFATVNVPGPDNHRARMPQESRRRTAALLDWMRDAFRIARERKLPALVLATHGNLWSGNGAYRQLLDSLAEEAQAYAGEVLVIHGDTHWFRFDQPLVDRRSGRAIPNVTRLEVFGSPFVDWVYVTVRTEDGRVRFTATSGSERVARRNR